ncbi:MAG: acyl-CoA dehydrogenase [Chloroflexi bacterium]|nr:acyl-CoA dehydrogenase [Chloroflexota bacterium]
MPDILMTQEELDFRREFREFLKKEIVPLGLAEKQERDEIDFPTELVRILGKKGYFGMCLPEKYGGKNRGLVYEVIKSEELAYVGPALSCPGCSTGWVGIAICKYGTEKQKKDYVIPISQGMKVAAIAMTEPGAGSDINSYKTKAVLDKDFYTVAGEKRFQVGGLGADFFVTFAITDTNKPALKGGLSAFLIDREMGIEVVEKFRMMGYHGAGVSHSIMKGIKVPKESILGKEGDGRGVLDTILIWERLSTAAGALGGARRCLDEAIKYSLEREAFGVTLSRIPTVYNMVADMIIKRDAISAMILRGCRLVDKYGPKAMKEIAEAKYLAGELGYQIADTALQVLGGIGYTNKYPIESYVRFVRLGRIASGTSEIMKYIVQRDTYKEVLGRKGAISGSMF